MAVTFSDLHTEAGLKALNEYLSGKTYISGYVLLNFTEIYCLLIVINFFFLVGFMFEWFCFPFR